MSITYRTTKDAFSSKTDLREGINVMNLSDVRILLEERAKNLVREVSKTQARAQSAPVVGEEISPVVRQNPDIDEEISLVNIANVNDHTVDNRDRKSVPDLRAEVTNHNKIGVVRKKMVVNALNKEVPEGDEMIAGSVVSRGEMPPNKMSGEARDTNVVDTERTRLFQAFGGIRIRDSERQNIKMASAEFVADVDTLKEGKLG